MLRYGSLGEVLEELGLESPRCDRVLAVDDEPDNLDVLAMILEDDWDVFTATSGPEALAVMEAQGPVDLVVADQRMPGMTGVELLAEVARRWPETLSFVLTGYSDVEPIVEAVNRGAVHRFLLKPWEAEEMRAAVADAMELKANRAALRRIVAALDARRAELQRNLRDLRRAQARLLATERLSTLGRLTSGIMHDVRNQLTAMMLLVRTLQTEMADEEVQRAGRQALGTLEKLYGIVQEVNTFARNATAELRPQTIDTRRLLEEAIGQVHGLGQGHELEVPIEVERGAEVIRGDRAWIRQAIEALLRRTEAGAPSGTRLRLLARDDAEGQTVLELRRLPAEARDAGAGLRQADEDAGEPASGLAVELARLAAEAHNGSLAIDPRSDGGTSIVFRIGPMPAADHAADGDGDGDEGSHSSAEEGDLRLHRDGHDVPASYGSGPESREGAAADPQRDEWEAGRP